MPRLRLLEAQARLDGRDPKAALAIIEALDVVKEPLGDDAIVIEADARARTNDEAGARAAYERYLKERTPEEEQR